MDNKISILIPCYNSEKFLPRLFESIHAQTIPFDEIICYDDCSTDNTASLAASLGARVIYGEINRGPSHGRNTMVKESTSDWIHFHDSDDDLNKHFVERMKASIVDNQTHLIVNCGAKDENGKLIGQMAEYNISPEDDAVEYFLNNIGLTIIGLYNRDYLLYHDIFFEGHLRYNEDPDFHVRLAAAGAKFKSLNETLVYKISHANSVSLKYWWSCISNQIYCLNYYLKILPHQYKKTLATKMTELAYYALRSKKPLIAQRALYSLKTNFNNNFTFSNPSLNKLSYLIGRRKFFPFIKFISRFI